MSGYMECQYCSNEFYAQRSSAKYCSDSCKSLANRKRRVQEQEFETNQQSLHELNNIILHKQEEILKAFELSKPSASAENQYAPELMQKEQDCSRSNHVTSKSNRSKNRLRLAAKNNSPASPAYNKGALIAVGVAGGLFLLNQAMNSSQQPIDDKRPVAPENE